VLKVVLWRLSLAPTHETGIRGLQSIILSRYRNKSEYFGVMDSRVEMDDKNLGSTTH
jgi:hypothetical protein